jgi:hypothetical protein
MSQVEAVYLSVLDEFFEESNSCVNVVQTSSRSHGRWRHLLIILTGGLAILNLLAAYKWSADAGVSGFLAAHLSLFAAIYAGTLAVVTNLESYHNFLGRAQAHRESREIFLDSYREFEMLWHIRVRPHGYRPEACVNAASLYRALVQRDRELRGKLRELTETKRATGPQVNANA